MVQKLHYLNETPSQTSGPYVHIGLAPTTAGFNIFDLNFGNVIAESDVPGERISVTGSIKDGMGSKIRDGLIEVWQANSAGHYPSLEEGNKNLVESGFRGWGRAATNIENGEWAFDTIKPGCVVELNEKKQAPHINFWIVARGINIGLNTRMYFADEEQANKVDPVLCGIQPKNRQKTLIASRDDSGERPNYRFDIVLQGEDETVFFDV